MMCTILHSLFFVIKKKNTRTCRIVHFIKCSELCALNHRAFQGAYWIPINIYSLKSIWGWQHDFICCRIWSCWAVIVAIVDCKWLKGELRTTVQVQANQREKETKREINIKHWHHRAQSCPGKMECDAWHICATFAYNLSYDLDNFSLEMLLSRRWESPHRLWKAQIEAINSFSLRSCSPFYWKWSFGCISFSAKFEGRFIGYWISTSYIWR